MKKARYLHSKQNCSTETRRTLGSELSHCYCQSNISWILNNPQMWWDGWGIFRLEDCSMPWSFMFLCTCDLLLFDMGGRQRWFLEARLCVLYNSLTVCIFQWSELGHLKAQTSGLLSDWKEWFCWPWGFHRFCSLSFIVTLFSPILTFCVVVFCSINFVGQMTARDNNSATAAGISGKMQLPASSDLLKFFGVSWLKEEEAGDSRHPWLYQTLSDSNDDYHLCVGQLYFVRYDV